MDGPRFDSLVKSFSVSRSRRELISGAIAGLGALALPVHGSAQRCREVGKNCTRSDKCCSGYCEIPEGSRRGACAECAGIDCNGLCCPPEATGCTAGPVIGCLCPQGTDYDFKRNMCVPSGECATYEDCSGDDVCCGGACCAGQCYGENFELCCNTSTHNFCGSLVEPHNQCCPPDLGCCPYGCIANPLECGGPGNCYDASTHGCCDGFFLYDLALFGCCGTQVYSLDTRVCCDETIFAGDCCTGRECLSGECVDHACVPPR